MIVALSRSLVVAFAALVALSACNENRAYPPCPPGVDPARVDCVPTIIGADTSGDTTLDVTVMDSGPGDVTPRPDVGPGEDVVCVPECGRRQCGSDGCGGTCGTCSRGAVCTADGFCEQEPGGLSCAEIVECVQTCNDELCWQRCMRQGSPDAQDTFDWVLECIQGECGHLADDPDRFGRCQQEQCAEPLSICLDQEFGTGDDTCEEVLECMFSCPGGACQEECYFEGTVDAQLQISDLFECAQFECEGVASVEEWYQCAEDVCPGPARSCFGAEPIEEGCSEEDLRRFEEFGEESAFIFADCGFSCLDAPAEESCSRECTRGPFDLSLSCAECTGELALCLADECAQECQDPLSGECEECMEDRNCIRDFERCAG